jgi:hypothetical protein
MSRIDGAVKNFPPECPCSLLNQTPIASSWPKTTGWQRMSEAAALPATPLSSAESAASNGEGTVADSRGVVQS